jgi:hypothetical protein
MELSRRGALTAIAVVARRSSEGLRVVCLTGGKILPLSSNFQGQHKFGLVL